MYEELTDELLQFLNATPTAFHAVGNFENLLLKAGFRRMSELEEYDLKPGDKAFVARNDSSLIAFSLPKTPDPAFRVVASHSDSPTLKLKPSPEIESGGFLRLNAEPYGGGLWHTWLDRPLTLAGRVLGLQGGEIRGKLVFPDRDLLLIPSLAIHMDHKANEALSLNPQQHLLPVLGLTNARAMKEHFVPDEKSCSLQKKDHFGGFETACGPEEKAFSGLMANCGQKEERRNEKKDGESRRETQKIRVTVLVTLVLSDLIPSISRRTQRLESNADCELRESESPQIVVG
ncbi:MAG: hypothetical protein ACSW8H_08300, partial [bacterium]